MNNNDKILSQKEKDKILYEFNDTYMEYNENNLFCHLFYEQAAKHLNDIALVYKKAQMTYSELNQRSNQLARILQRKGIGKEDVIGIMLTPCFSMFTGTIGILKARAAYMPIDPNYPVDRITYMLKDSSAKVLLTEKSLYDKVSFDGDIIAIDDEEIYRGVEKDDLLLQMEKTDLAYVIYTSGSTGKPKGVMIEQDAFTNFIHWYNSYYEVSREDRVTKYAGFGFDASVCEMFPALVKGAQMHIIDSDLKLNLKELNEYYLENEITISFLPTQVCEQFIRLENNKLKKLLTGGEKLKYYQKKPYKIIDNYGPTENTVVSTTFIVDKEYRNIPIGKPVFNSKAYVLNEKNELAGIGEIGELALSGKGLARGYINQELLTKERFIDNPFMENERMYRTGDLVRWLEDGNLEFIRRNDEQVKIRGYRIELGEIDYVIRNHSNIKDSTVLVRENANGIKFLCAYIVLKTPMEEEKLKEDLNKTLPEYMVPSTIIYMDEIPLTPNGKVDKATLLKIEIKSSVEYIPPKSDDEKLLVDIFCHVLGLDRVGIQDNFFQIGGQSLLANLLINKIEEVTGSRLSFHEIFNNPTVERIASLLSKGKRNYEDIFCVEEKEYYKMSAAEKRMYTIWQMDETKVAYNLPQMFRVEGNVDIERLKQAFTKLIARHEILRTSFHMKASEFVQRVEENVEMEISYEEVKDKSIEVLFHENIREFQLDKPPLMRAKLLKRDTEYLLFFDMHHIISDGMSMWILMDELSKLYDGEELQQLSVQYKDYSAWMEGRDLSSQKEYWLEEFSDEVPVLDLPYDFNRAAMKSFAGEELCIEINSLYDEVEQFASKKGVTSYMVFLASLMVLLSKYSGQEDIVIGSPVLARTHSKTEKMLGMFVNTAALRGKPRSQLTFLEFLLEVKQKAIKAYENQEYCFDELVEELDLPRDYSRNPIFDVMFALQNNQKALIRTKELQANCVIERYNAGKFDLTITVEDKILTIGYCSDLFKEKTIQKFMGHLVELLKNIVREPDKRIGDIEIVSDEERKKILTDFNATEVFYDNDKLFCELFKEQVKISPEGIALVHQNANMTYGELDEKSSLLAQILRNKGIEKEDIVGIMLSPSFSMFIGTIGAWKAGAAYLPIDSDYPEERISYMLKDSGAKALITEKSLCNQIAFDGQLIVLDDDNLFADMKNKKALEDVYLNEHDLAYVIYTSGSTGKPKGVMVEHGSLANLVKWHIKYYGITKNDISTKYAGFGFDASVWEMYPYLAIGAQLHIIDSSLRTDVFQLNEYYIKHGITISFLPTQMCEQFMKLENHTIKQLLAGGEKLKNYENKSYKVINNYGPTENTVVSTSFVIDQAYDNIPIGKPIYNTKVYILDANEKLVPIGVKGELIVSGKGLARGYLNQADLTTEKFVPNSVEGKGRMYKTGDLARWRADGTIEYLGRKDEQVKIRGFRIELGEIDAVLRKHRAVKDSVVVVKEREAESCICAYVVLAEDIELFSLKKYIAKELPAYMIPTCIMTLEQLPITKNGKVDKRALPEILLTNETEYVAPSNKIEEQIVLAFQQIFDASRISVEDNFFELGGDSIKALRIVSKLREAGYQLSVKELMNSSDIKEIAKCTKKTSNSIMYSQNEVTGQLPLSPVQSMFFSWQLIKPNHFNQSVMLRSHSRLNENGIKESLNALIKHHDILRAVYIENRQEIKKVENSLLYRMETYLYEEIEDTEQLSQVFEKQNTLLQSTIDLENGPLVHVGLYKTRKFDYIMICIHHLVVDSVSWRILLEDFVSGYQQSLRGQEVRLPEKTASYKDWSNALVEYRESKDIREQTDYWKRISEGIYENRLAYECKISDKVEFQSVTAKIDQEKTKELLFCAGKAYGTEINDLLLTALGLAVKKWTGQKRIAIALEGHGREELHKKIIIDRTVGWFTTIYPVLLQIEDGIGKSIIEIKEMLRRIPNNGIGYGLIKYGCEPVLPFVDPDISFNYLGDLDNDMIDKSYFDMGEFSAGSELAKENKLQNDINFNGGISNGILQMEIYYNKCRFEGSSIGQLANHFEEALIDVINHCITLDESIMTASDFGVTDMSAQAFEELIDMF